VFNGGYRPHIDRSRNRPDHRGPVQVVQQRTHPHEAYGAEELLIMQRTVGFAELGVPLVGHVAEALVKGHPDAVFLRN
jgi:hypothetical protein